MEHECGGGRIRACGGEPRGARGAAQGDVLQAGENDRWGGVVDVIDAGEQRHLAPAARAAAVHGRLDRRAAVRAAGERHSAAAGAARPAAEGVAHGGGALRLSQLVLLLAAADRAAGRAAGRGRAEPLQRLPTAVRRRLLLHLAGTQSRAALIVGPRNTVDMDHLRFSGPSAGGHPCVQRRGQRVAAPRWDRVLWVVVCNVGTFQVSERAAIKSKQQHDSQ